MLLKRPASLVLNIIAILPPLLPPFHFLFSRLNVHITSHHLLPCLPQNVPNDLIHHIVILPNEKPLPLIPLHHIRPLNGKPLPSLVLPHHQSHLENVLYHLVLHPHPDQKNSPFKPNFTPFAHLSNRTITSRYRRFLRQGKDTLDWKQYAQAVGTNFNAPSYASILKKTF